VDSCPASSSQTDYIPMGLTQIEAALERAFMQADEIEMQGFAEDHDRSIPVINERGDRIAILLVGKASFNGTATSAKSARSFEGKYPLH
jgi:hypothetical protein